MKHGYVWHIVFAGNRGHSVGHFGRIENAYQRRSDARAAAQAANGTGLRYGASAKRRRVPIDEKAKARQALT